MIRKLRSADLETVLTLWREGNLQAHPFIPPEYWLSHESEVRTQLPQADVFVWEENGEILGFLGLWEEYIAGVFVRCDTRSRGIGAALMYFVKARHRRLTLRVYRRNTRALAFYRREQFSVQNMQCDPETGELEYEMVWTADKEFLPQDSPIEFDRKI